MKLNWKSLVKYTLSLCIAIGLFVYLYKDVNMGDMLKRLGDVNYVWIIVSLSISTISHISRGWRWQLVLKPLGYSLNGFRGFLAVMVGYLANLILPRMGEVSRCALVKHTDDIPVNISFGTVVAERALDFIILLSLLGFTLLVEFDRLSDLILHTLGEKSENASNKIYWLIGIGFIAILGILILYLLRKKLAQIPIYQKVIAFLVGLKNGVISIFKLKRTALLLYIFHTIVVWVCYYGMTYVVFFAMPSTSHLGLSAGLLVLIAGGFGMAAPVQGGVGFYHLFVAAGLMAFGVSQEDGQAFALLIHSSQLVMIGVIGGLSLLIALLLKKNKQSQTPPVT